MIDYYLIDAQGIYATGVQIDPMAPLPGAGTLTAPPETTGTQVAQWRGDAWLILPVRPPLPEPPPPPVPQTVSRAQGKAALIHAGLWSQITAFVAAIPDDTERALAEVALNDTQEWRRDSAFLGQAAQALGLDDAALDALFIAAAGVQL